MAAGWRRGRCTTHCPLLAKANALTILSVNEPVSAEASADRLAARLASLGLPAKIVPLQADHSDIQPTILSATADESLDLLVMGGYGHSRLREVVLGGVTRDMFRSHDGADLDVALRRIRKRPSIFRN